MKGLKFFYLVTGFLVVFLAAGCSEKYHLDSVVTGTIEEINEEDKELIVTGGSKESSQKDNTYEIPVSDTEEYKIGQKIEVTIYSELE